MAKIFLDMTSALHLAFLKKVDVVVLSLFDEYICECIYICLVGKYQFLLHSEHKIA